MISGTLPTLVLSAPEEIEGIYTVNGSMLGEVGRRQDSLSLPVTPTGSVYLGFAPLCGDWVPITRKLSFLNGSPDFSMPRFWEDVSLKLWPANLCEVQLMPRRLNRRQNTPPPQTLAQAMHEEMTGYLYRDDGQLLLILEDTPGHITHCEALSFSGNAQLSVREVCGGGMDFVVTGTDEHGNEFLSVLHNEGGEWRKVYEGSARRARILGTGQIELVESINDTRMHELRRYLRYENSTFVEGEHRVSLPGSAPYPQNPQSIVSAFLDAVKLREEGEACAYLTPQLIEGLSFGSIVDFFGEFAALETPRYPIAGLVAGQVMGVRYPLVKTMPLLERVKLFDFEIAVASNRIDNIREI